MNINPTSNISYTATIKADKAKITGLLSNDPLMNVWCLQGIEGIVDEVHRLADMPEKSVVSLIPQQYLKGKAFRLLGIVQNEEGTVRRVIEQRDARRLATDTEFAQRYINSIKKAITDVEIEGVCVQKIKDTFQNSKTIKGRLDFRGENIMDRSTEEVSEYFLDQASLDIDQMFLKDINPTDNIVNVLKGIDERNPEYHKYIFIGREKKGVTKLKVVYKDPNENCGFGPNGWVPAMPRMERSVPLHSILRESTVTCLDRLTKK